MTRTIKPLLLAGFAFAGAAAFATAAPAGDFSSSASYNNPIGMSSAQENAPVNTSLRDANGNLVVVNGQITSSSFAEVGGVQSATSTATGVGSTSTMFGTATAIGNSLNVVTTGSNNIVIVSSTQTNNGNQTANTTLSGQ